MPRTPRNDRRILLQKTGGILAAITGGCASFPTHPRGNSSSTERESTTEQSTIAPAEEPTTTTRESTPTESIEPVDTWRASQDPLRFTLTFDQRNHSDETRYLKVDEIVLRGGTGHRVRTYDIGGPAEQLRFVKGKNPVRRSDGRTWRWFGTPTTVELPEEQNFSIRSSITVRCKPATADPPLTVTTYAQDVTTTTMDMEGWQKLDLRFT